MVNGLICREDLRENSVPIQKDLRCDLHALHTKDVSGRVELIRHVGAYRKSNGWNHQRLSKRASNGVSDVSTELNGFRRLLRKTYRKTDYIICA